MSTLTTPPATEQELDDLLSRPAGGVGAAMGIDPVLVGEESSDALLSSASEIHDPYGYPSVPLRRLVRSVGHRVAGGSRQLGKATKFQQREGKF